MLRIAEDFEEAPDMQKACDLDRELSLLRFAIGEKNFASMHYFIRLHQQTAKYIDEADKHMRARHED